MADPGRSQAQERAGVLVLNQISAQGLSRLPADRYRVGKDVAAPAAILVRSADLHGLAIPASVMAIGRAGAGTNNIPVKAMSERGVPVFNAPGANANAVKELVLAGMLMAARNLAPALRFTAALDVASPDLEKAVEDGKKAFAGFEIAGQTLGIIGLGKIGCLIADAASHLGQYVCDFQGAEIHGHPKIIALPHLGASTREAEENCAIMVVDQVRDYLENGNVVNAVNFPN